MNLIILYKISWFEFVVMQLKLRLYNHYMVFYFLPTLQIKNSYFDMNLNLNHNLYIKYRSLSKRWIPYRQYYVWYFTKRFINFSMNKRCLIIFWPTPIWMLSLVANIIQRLFEHISLNHLVIQVCKGASKQNNDCYVC